MSRGQSIRSRWWKAQINKLIKDISLNSINWFRTGIRWFMHGVMAYLVGMFTASWMQFVLSPYVGVIDGDTTEMAKVLAWAFTLIYLVFQLPIDRKKGGDNG